MSRRYRFVHFHADPFLGTRFPIGAIVETDTGPRFVEAQHMPDKGCIGDPRNLALLQFVLRALRDAHSFEPDSPAPTVSFDVPRALPDDLQYPMRWIEDTLNGGRRTADDVWLTGSTIHERAPRRSSLGRRFFEQQEVAQYVRDTFTPGQSIAGILASAAGLEPITQYVVGTHDLLLLEPIVPGRKSFGEDLVQINTRFAAYRHALDQSTQPGWSVGLIAVVLHGSKEGRIRAGLALGGNAEVVDTGRFELRVSLVDRIRKLGMDAQRAGEGAMLPMQAVPAGVSKKRRPS